MAEIDVLKAQIVRDNPHTPWGFRLHGGVDYGQPLKIVRITPGSPAARIGLKADDEVTEIGDTPTEHMSHQQALDVIQQYGNAIILTVERCARGGRPPVQPVISSPPPGPPPQKFYQPYDMAKPDTQFHTVAARPFQAPPQRIVQQVPGRDFQLQYDSGPAIPPPTAHYSTAPVSPHTTYYEDMEPDRGGHAQSRTFNVLQSLMENEGSPSYQSTTQPSMDSPMYGQHDSYKHMPQHYHPQSFQRLEDMAGQYTEPGAGISALPPPRSAYMERKREEERMRKAASPRVKVFMPQQYNSPMGMYSAQNVMDTFQTQAEGLLQEMEENQMGQ